MMAEELLGQPPGDIEFISVELENQINNALDPMSFPAPWWCRSPPDDSSQTMDSTSYNSGQLPIAATGYDAFVGNDMANISPTLSGSFPRRQDLPQNQPQTSPFSSLPCNPTVFDLADDHQPSESRGLICQDIDSRLSPRADSSHPATASATGLEAAQRSRVVINPDPGLDQASFPKTTPQNHEHPYREIAPKSPLATVSVPTASQYQYVEQDQVPSSDESIARELSIRPHSRPYTLPKNPKERPRAERSIPETYFCDFAYRPPGHQNEISHTSPGNHPAKRTTAKKSARLCLRCKVFKEKCDGNFPCGRCQKFWGGKEHNTIFWSECVDQDINELNFLAGMFQLLLRFPAEDQDSMFSMDDFLDIYPKVIDAAGVLVAMAVDSPIDAGLHIIVQQAIHNGPKLKPFRKTTSESYFSRIWRPRKPIDQYPNAKVENALLIATLLQQDSISSMTGLSRNKVYGATFGFLTLMFHRLKRDMNIYGTNRTSADESFNIRNRLIRLLVALREVSSPIWCTGLLWQEVFLLADAKDFKRTLRPINCKSYNRHRFRYSIACISSGFAAVSKDQELEKFVDRMGQASNQLHLYCSHWIRKLDPDYSTKTLSIYNLEINFLLHALKLLVVDPIPSSKTVNSVPPNQQIQLSSGIRQSLAIIFFIYEDSEISSTIVKNLKIEELYRDFTDSASDLNKLQSYLPLETGDMIEVVARAGCDCFDDVELRAAYKTVLKTKVAIILQAWEKWPSIGFSGPSSSL